MATAVIRALYLIALMSPAVGRINRGLAVLASKGRFCRGLLPSRALGFQSIPISGLRLPPTTILPQTIEQRRMVTSATARITDDIKTAAKELREDGRLVAFPTETVYGLGANAYNETAVRYVFQVSNSRSCRTLSGSRLHKQQLGYVPEILSIAPEKTSRWLILCAGQRPAPDRSSHRPRTNTRRGLGRLPLRPWKPGA
jgi:hypothetical protein